jgi:site-specific recombinase XerD
MLEIYRRHNRSKCASTDTQKCKARRPCPIWIRGTRPDGRYVRQPLKLRDWNRATDHLRLMETGQEIPKPASANVRAKVTLDDWRDRYASSARSENVGEDTVRKYKLLFRLLAEFATPKGIKHPDEFDIDSLRQFRSTWKDDAPASRMKKQERLKKIFRFAHDSGWVEKNVAKELGKILVDPTQKSPFDDDEMKKIIEAARDKIREAMRANKALAIESARAVCAFIISDVCMLRRDALTGDHLVVRAIKNSGDVKVLLPAVVANELRAIKPATQKYFFWNEKSKVTSVTDLWRMHKLKPIFEKAEIRDAHPHRFRHTFAAGLLVQGSSTKVVADLLGNSEKIVEKHYSRWIAGRQNALDEAVTKANREFSLAPV